MSEDESWYEKNRRAKEKEEENEQKAKDANKNSHPGQDGWLGGTVAA